MDIEIIPESLIVKRWNRITVEDIGFIRIYAAIIAVCFEILKPEARRKTFTIILAIYVTEKTLLSSNRLAIEP